MMPHTLTRPNSTVGSLRTGVDVFNEPDGYAPRTTRVEMTVSVALTFHELLGMLTDLDGVVLTWADLDDDHAIRDAVRYQLLTRTLDDVDAYAHDGRDVHQGRATGRVPAEYAARVARAITRVFGVIPE